MNFLENLLFVGKCLVLFWIGILSIQIHVHLHKMQCNVIQIFFQSINVNGFSHLKEPKMG